MKKNSTIELMRFLGATIIFLYHQGVMFDSGWIFVEFFFMVSGYFTCVHMHRNPVEANDPNFPMRYTWHKAKGILPYAAMTTLAQAAITIPGIIRNYGAGSAYTYLLTLPGNLLGLIGTGIVPWHLSTQAGYTLNYMIAGILWFLMALLVAMPVFIFLVHRVEPLLGMWTYTVLPLVLYGLLITNFGTLNGWHPGPYVYLSLDCRALGGLLFGDLIWHGAGYLRNHIVRASASLLTFTEAVSFLFALLLATADAKPIDCPAIIFMALCLSLTMSGKTYSCKLNFRAFRFLGSISLQIYCFQWQASQLVRWIGGLAGYRAVAVSYCILVLISITIKACGKRLGELEAKAFARLINENEVRA